MDDQGNLIQDENPKVFLGKGKPKKFDSVVSLPEWMERKRFKNTVVQELHRRGGVTQVWTSNEDVDTVAWQNWKKESGFLRVHMDELIRRGNEGHWMKSRTDRRGDPPSKFVAEILRAAAHKWIGNEALRPAVAHLNISDSSIGQFLCKPHGEEGCVTTIEFSATQFVGGVMDLCYLVPVGLEAQGFAGTAMFTPLFETLNNDPYDLLHVVPRWMIIGDSRNKMNIKNSLLRFFPGYNIETSDYVSTVAETSFHGLKARNRGGTQTIIFIVHDDHTPEFELSWPSEVTTSDPRFLKKQTYFGEQKLKAHDDELRMETYIRFIHEVLRVTDVTTLGGRNFACVLAGRKPMLAALVRY